MDHPLSSLIDIQMRQAQKDGKFDNLPGQGRPIKDLHAPKDAVIDRLLKESKARPPFVEFKRQAEDLRKTLSATSDPAERKTLMTQIADLELRAALEFEATKKFG